MSELPVPKAWRQPELRLLEEPIKVAAFIIPYHDGQRVRSISSSHLREIRSRVTTHEGELLLGRAGRKYMDKYSKTYLGKNMEGIYRKDKVGDR